MDCIVAFASPPSPTSDVAGEVGARPAHPPLPPTPHLRALLAALREQPFQARVPSGATPLSLSTSTEQVRAHWMGLNAPDGCIPWASLERAAAGEAAADEACAWFHPCHWHIAHDHVRMQDPESLGLSEAHSRALCSVLSPFLAEDGIELSYRTPTRWLARGEGLRGLPCASLDRVVGRRLEPWMDASGPAARRLRRLQQEVQMLLYTHPLSSAPGGPTHPVNSFWLSGAGALVDAWPVGTPRDAALATALGTRIEICEALRPAALLGDAQAWACAWLALDSGPLARVWGALKAGEPVRLALCGERGARVFAGQGTGWRARWRLALRAGPSLAEIGETI